MLLLLLACAPHPAPPVASTPPAASTAAVAPGAPVSPAATVSPPVTLDAFRAAFPVGTRIRLSIAAKDQPTVEERWTWTAADATGCTIASQVYDANGSLLQDEGSANSTWEELMAHARFPADATTQADGHIVVPAGEFDTWVFTVHDTAEDGAPRVRTFQFAKTKPGPPLLYTIEQGGEEVFRMTMLER
jgi:hypothetical protein